MSATHVFDHQNAFEEWLKNHHEEMSGIWIRFDKTQKTSTLTADEALQTALCFGWIDGLIKRLDDQFYIKYFTRRRPKSIWSTKNKRTVEALIGQGLMKAPGLKAISDAKKDGRWDKADSPPEDFSLDAFLSRLDDAQLAKKHYLAFSPSVQKTYAMSYYALKRPESRAKRLKVIVERLEKNLKPM